MLFTYASTRLKVKKYFIIVTTNIFPTFLFPLQCNIKARLHGGLLSQQLDAIFVVLKLQLQNRRCKPGAIFSAICRHDIAGVSNIFET